MTQTNNKDSSEENIDALIKSFIENNYTGPVKISLELSIRLVNRYSDIHVQDNCLDLIMSGEQFERSELIKAVRDTITIAIEDLLENIGIVMQPETQLLTKCSLLSGLGNMLSGDNIPVLAGILDSSIEPNEALGVILPLISNLTYSQISINVDTVSKSLVRRIMLAIETANINNEAKENFDEVPDTYKIKEDIKILSEIYPDNSILAVDLIAKGIEIGLNFKDYIPYLKENKSENEAGRALAILSLLLLSNNGNKLTTITFHNYADNVFSTVEDIKNCEVFINMSIKRMELERTIKLRKTTYSKRP